MNKRLFLLGLLTVLLVVPVVIADELVILHTNDTHSNLFPFGPHDQYGGIARMSTKIKQIRAKNRNVLVLHAGDMFVGTFAFNKYLGYPEFKIMEGLYDAMALGNHEFDLEQPKFLDQLDNKQPGYFLGTILAGSNPFTGDSFGDEVTLLLLSANLNLSKFPDLEDLVDPYKILDIGGIKVGLLGVITNEPFYYSFPIEDEDNEDPFIYSPYGAAGEAAAILKAEGCDVVIAISHLGKIFDEIGLSTVPNIDIIVGGHSHDEMFAKNINGKIIVQAGAFGKNLGELRVDVNGSIGNVTFISHKLHPITKEIRKDPSLLGYLNELRTGIYKDPRYGPVYSRHIAKAMWDHEEKWLPYDDPNQQPGWKDTPLGNLVTDAIVDGLKIAGYSIDFALEPNGFIGHKIYADKVVGNDLMRVLPYGYDPVSGFGSKIKIVNLHALEIVAGLEYMVSNVEYSDETSPQVSGLTFEYDSNKSAFSRVDHSSIKINNEPMDPTLWYAVALNERLVEFLGELGIDMSIPGRMGPDPDLLEFDLVEDYMRMLNHLEYTSENRIIDTNELPNNN